MQRNSRKGTFDDIIFAHHHNPTFQHIIDVPRILMQADISDGILVIYLTGHKKLEYQS